MFISYFTISASIEIVKDKENTMEQAGFIGGSALFGYILGAFSRRARLLKKLVYSGTLGGGAGYVCYPEEMTAAANYAAEEGNKLGLIAYNFIAGGKLTQPSISPCQNLISQALFSVIVIFKILCYVRY